VYQDYKDDGFMPLMVFYDGTPDSLMELANEKGLTFPLLSDPDKTVFGRWNPESATPKTTLLERGAKVYEVDSAWRPALIEELLYGVEDDDDW